MIRFVDCAAVRADFERVLEGRDLLHACMLHNHLRAASALRDAARFWVVYEDAQPRAAVAQADGAFLLCDNALTQPQELIEFLRFLDAGVVCGRRALLEKLYAPLELGAPHGAPVMAFQPSAAPPDPQARRITQGRRPVYDMLRACYEDFFDFGNAGTYETWLAAQCLRERGSVCGLYVVEEDGAPAATASIVACSARAADIGNIATRPQSRGKGYASRLTLHLAGVARAHGLTPILCCAKEALVPFYRRLGFEECDVWAACAREPHP